MNLQPVRLRPGVDLRAAVQQLVASCAGGSAFLVAGIGSLTQAQLRFAGEADGTRLEGPLEITTLCGTLTPDGAHLHMTVADAQGRVDRMIESSRVEAETQAQAAVAHLTTQVNELTSARDASRTQLADLRAKLDKALTLAEG